MSRDRIRVEVAYASNQTQFLRQLEVEPGSTIADAISKSAVEEVCGFSITELSVGIWSRPATRQTCLSDGDRVEIYRPLKVDPKDARRQRARKPVR